MIYGLYCIRDLKANYGAPFCEQSDGSAMRAFEMGIRTADLMRNFPQDFRLYSIGSFDDSNGVIDYHDIVPLMDGTDVDIDG